jgi:hypothetical protein
MTTENENKLSAKNETEIEVENMKSALSKMTDADIQNIFDRTFEDFQRSKLDPNYENKD